MSILVSGGAGYIGSHTCVELLNAGYDIVVADNYYNSCPEALKRVREITGKDFKFVEADMTDHAAVEKVFAENPGIDCVIQFAAYKAVGESVSKPIEYYSNNLNCTLNILDVMRRYDCHNIIFSSSATVYGDPASVPIREDFPVGSTPSVHILPERSARTRTASPTTWCPTSPKLPLASWKKCMCTAMITLPPMAPACATTSTLWTWPAAMWQPSKSWKKSPACSSATWAPATATVCWM